jgi:hypothetical protein
MTRSDWLDNSVWAMPSARAFVLRMASLFGVATRGASIPIARLQRGYTPRRLRLTRPSPDTAAMKSGPTWLWLAAAIASPFDRILAMPSARAGHASHRALLRSLGHSVPIAIAVFAATWFAAALVSGAGQ